MLTVWYCNLIVSHVCVPFYEQNINYTKIQTHASLQAQLQGPPVLGKSYLKHSANACLVQINQ